MKVAGARERMVNLQLAARGIADSRVLQAFREVPREAFLPVGLEDFAYDDGPLPIGEKQTISQPYIVGLTAQALALNGHEHVLEVGTGSGYAAAILSRLVARVTTIERLPALAEAARGHLARLGYENVEVLLGDGTLGRRDRAPYDAIAVAAGGPLVPNALCEQLALGGRLVIPVGTREDQKLVRITRTTTRTFAWEPLSDVRFVPLIGAQGWSELKAPAAPSGVAPALTPSASL
jgi:protein-L-isoaspartate(D-aspartate) O-methyltransferase